MNSEKAHDYNCPVHNSAHVSFNTSFVPDAPEVIMMGYDGNWFVGRENVQLKCKADANPTPSAYIWSRYVRFILTLKSNIGYRAN